MKTCSKCKNEYPAMSEYFYSDKRAKDGLQSSCRDCSKAYHILHRTKGNARSKAWRRSHKTEAKAYKKVWYKSHKTEVVAYTKRYYSTIAGHIDRLMGNIRERCYNPNCKYYKNYGGKGITLKFTKQELTAWLSENGIDPRGLQIHRKDNDGNYALDNIEFLDRSKHIILHENK